MKPQTGLNRLLKLADHLDTVPRREFNYNYWKHHNEPEYGEGCGTVACALGHACMMPRFKRLGLHFINSTPVVMDDQGEEIYYQRAAAVIFGLTFEEATELFIPGSRDPIRSPKFVAKKIRRFVKAKLAELKGVRS